MQPINSLTGLRFFAAYVVVGSHFFSFSGPLDFLNGIFARGHLGVEFFFILSGFVLGARYREDIVSNEFNKLQFFLFRMARIAPAYYLSLILALPTLYFGIKNADFLYNKINLTTVILTNLTFSQSFVPASNLLENWNVPSWSLSVEFIFYLLFPFISVRALKSKGENLLILICILVSSLIFLVCYFLPERVIFLGTETLMTWVNIPLLRLPQFILGSLLAKKFLQTTPTKFSTYGYWLSLIATIFLFLCPFPLRIIGMGSPISILIFSSLIYFTAQTDKGGGPLNNKILLYLGEASYSLYIFQAPLKVIFQQIYSKVLQLGDTAGPLYSIYLSLTLISASVVLYTYFELPINKYLRQKIIHGTKSLEKN